MLETKRSQTRQETFRQQFVRRSSLAKGIAFLRRSEKQSEAQIEANQTDVEIAGNKEKLETVVKGLNAKTRLRVMKNI